MVRVVQRVLHEVCRVAEAEVGVLGGDFHLLEVGPFPVFVVHRGGGVEEAADGVDASGDKEAVAFPLEGVAYVADGAGGLNDLSCGHHLGALYLIASQSVLLLAHPVCAACEGDVGPLVGVGDGGDVVCAGHVGGEAYLGLVAPYQRVAYVFQDGEVAGVDLCGFVVAGVVGVEGVRPGYHHRVLEQAYASDVGPCVSQFPVFLLLLVV